MDKCENKKELKPIDCEYLSEMKEQSIHFILGNMCNVRKHMYLNQN